MSDIDKNQFITDVFSAISGMGIWQSFLNKMKVEFGYEEEAVEKLFDEIQEG